MFIFIRALLLVLISTLIMLFLFYIRFTFILDTYFQWFFNDVRDMQQYDYIVVGAGSAGTVLAKHLAEDKHSVLLLEAGGTAPFFLDIPLLGPLIQNTVYDWQYVTVPQEHACKGLINNQSRWPRGRILGGSSRLNYMAYVLGHRLDYEKWFPDFAESVTESAESLSISELRWNSDFAEVILKAIEELNYNVSSVNAQLDTDFMKVQLTMENGGRWSSDKILYEKPNRLLTVCTHAHATKILINSNKAEGIEFVKFGRKYTAIAKHGVILSAGVIESPKLLMLSGIGPKEHLQEFGIKVINDLPVGQNLQDHILTGLDLIVLNESLGLNPSDIFNPMSAFNYFFFGKGPWTSSGIEVLGTFHSPLHANKSAVPDLQLMVLPSGVSRDNGFILKETMGISDEVYNKYFTPLLDKNIVTIAPVLLHPKSTGELRLKSNDPFHKPLIDPKYLSNEDDIDTLIEGLYFIKKLLNTNTLRALGASLNRKPFPGCEDQVFDTRKYWKCYIQHLTMTSYHPVGTCRIGDIVDTSFKVYNMRNLYVVDASVLPSLPSGNINAPVLAVAQKAAYIFKNKRTKERIGQKQPKSYNICYVFNVCSNMRSIMRKYATLNL
ncbi:PREDICTED: glucose dehydrogenase [FAD, quinone]-like [Vollenhovia emeryi]|uniref:glucose dehydrogenase [FAD, quinone]-like n=1 Tax=Vollenhovia emeryi TaxID=411798 RepID=UPI0005F3C94B|nr:PREDICTED: glucose dehydrogenase [FAD, quinone]-like [Vollenhovia emeryi]XP_011873624.1 PREDICTED: glucose dehydrogenase [FAD, quinone]-like [Vollenhovia emeryi]XP_011873625.1 PREDICTED: glucose dehydrogenase [FAD, quinone]-like [Vollenhovia emeryi]